MKRKLSLILVFAMLMSLIVMPSASAVGNTFTDVNENTDYRTAIVNLSKISLINGEKNEDGTYAFRPDSSITRAEFTAILVRALGAGDVGGTADQFSDVSGHWAESNISVACSRGIILGFEDGTFRPDENVTYEQAMKMIVCTLGYDADAKSLGGWPNGYMSEGAKLGVNTGVKSLEQDKPAPRGVIAQLIYNTLDIKVMEVAQIGMETNNEKKTFMEKYLNLERSKAIIIGVESDVTNALTERTGKTEVGKQQMAVLIDNEVYYLTFTNYSENKEDVSKYLGQTVNIFYKTDVMGSDDVLIDIDAETTKNTVTKISYKDLYTCDDSQIKYFDSNGKTKTLKYNSDTSVIYNGSLVTDDIKDKLKGWLTDGEDEFIYGEVVATDSGDTGTLNIIEITDYEIIVAAKTVSASDHKITNKLKFENKQYMQVESAVIDPDDVTYESSIKYNGNEIEVTSIKQNDVILYSESDNGDKRKALVSRTPVTGTVTGYSSDDQTVTINSKTYDIHDVCLQYFKENGMELKVSASVTLYIDAFDVVVYGTISSTQEVSPYAYIISSGKNDDDDNYFVTLYVPATGAYKNYKLKDKVSFNGSTKKDADVVAALKENSRAKTSDGKYMFFDDYSVGIYSSKKPPYLNEDGSGNSAEYRNNAAQIARVTVAGDTITNIVTAEAKIGETTEDSSALVKYSNLAKLNYSGSRSFGSKFYYDSNTMVIFIPEDRTNSKSYSKKNVSYFTSGTEYYVEAYNVNKSKVAGLILIYGKNASSVGITQTTPISVVGEAFQDEDVDGEVKLKMPLYMASSTISEKIAADTDEFEKCNIGDVIQFGYDSSNEASGLETRIKMSDIQKVLEDASDELIDGVHEEGNVIYDWSVGLPSSYTNTTNAIKTKFCYQTKEGYTTEYKYARAFMANVIEVDDDDNTIRVTPNGFTWNTENDKYEIENTDHEERLEITDKTEFVRYDSKKNKITPYVDGSSQAKITISDLKDARYSDTECSKILIFLYPGSTVKFICIYE